MAMNQDTYYRDHWVEIEPDRLEAYEQRFEWRPQNAPLLEPARLAPGQTVVDYGCGPGGLAVELARRVAPNGRVHGVDLNKAFLERAAARSLSQSPPAAVTRATIYCGETTPSMSARLSRSTHVIGRDNMARR